MIDFKFFTENIIPPKNRQEVTDRVTEQMSILYSHGHFTENYDDHVNEIINLVCKHLNIHE